MPSARSSRGRGRSRPRISRGRAVQARPPPCRMCARVLTAPRRCAPQHDRGGGEAAGRRHHVRPLPGSARRSVADLDHTVVAREGPCCRGGVTCNVLSVLAEHDMKRKAPHFGVSVLVSREESMHRARIVMRIYPSSGLVLGEDGVVQLVERGQLLLVHELELRGRV
jgi:hypothetical protein